MSDAEMEAVGALGALADAARWGGATCGVVRPPPAGCSTLGRKGWVAWPCRRPPGSPAAGLDGAVAAGAGGVMACPLSGSHLAECARSAWWCGVSLRDPKALLGRADVEPPPACTVHDVSRPFWCWPWP